MFRAALSMTTRRSQRGLKDSLRSHPPSRASDGSVSAELLRRFRQQAPRQAVALPLRTAGELRAKAEAIARKRLDAARQREVRERARREREERAASKGIASNCARLKPFTLRQVAAPCRGPG
jgi:hypothetical protein